MNSTEGKPKVMAKAFLLLSFVALAPIVRSQAKQPPRLDRESSIATAREVMITARYCALITLDSTGRPHARTMDPFPPDAQMIVWLATNPKSRKVAEIRRHRRVTLYYFDRESQAYVTLSGIARIVNDAEEKARHWKDEWKDFYPDREKSYLLNEFMASVEFPDSNSDRAAQLARGYNAVIAARRLTKRGSPDEVLMNSLSATSEDKWITLHFQISSTNLRELLRLRLSH